MENVKIILISPNKPKSFQVYVGDKWELREDTFNSKLIDPKDYAKTKCVKLLDNSILFTCTSKNEDICFKWTPFQILTDEISIHHIISKFIDRLQFVRKSDRYRYQGRR